MDHNETPAGKDGHDVYAEGLHIDVVRQSNSTVKLDLTHAPLPENRGVVIRGCVDYFDRHAEYFIKVREGDVDPVDPPNWRPDGGDPTPTLMFTKLLREDMSQEPSAEEGIPPEDLTAILADATDTPAEEIDRQARELDIAPPEEASVDE